MVGDAISRLGSQQSRQSRKIVILVKIKQHLAVVQILHDDGLPFLLGGRCIGREDEQENGRGQTKTHVRLLPLLDVELGLLLELTI